MSTQSIKALNLPDLTLSRPVGVMLSTTVSLQFCIALTNGNPLGVQLMSKAIGLLRAKVPLKLLTCPSSILKWVSEGIGLSLQRHPVQTLARPALFQTLLIGFVNLITVSNISPETLVHFSSPVFSRFPVTPVG